MPELATASAVQAWTGADATTATALIAHVEARIANYCNRRTEDGSAVWEDSAKTEFIDGELSQGVLLNWRPIVAVSSVTIITSSSTSTSYTLTDLTVDGIEISGLAANPAPYGFLMLRNSGTYVWDSEYIMARSARVSSPNFGAGRKRIKVVYTGGYTTIPSDLTLAAKIACKNVYDAKQVSGSVQSESLGNYSYTNKDGSTIDTNQWSFGGVLDLLQPYRSYARIV